MMKKTITLGAFIALFILGTVSCGSIKGTDMISLLSKNDWVLDTVKGNDIAPESFMDGAPSLNFSDNLGVSGSDGCNRFTGKLDLDDDKLRFGNFASTKMACMNDVSNDFTKLLSQVTNFTVNDSSLRLLSGESEIMTFVKK